MIKFIAYPTCSTCKKAQKWLEDNNLEYELRNIKDENPSADELRLWHRLSGLELKRFFNTSGLIYRSMSLKDKLPSMSEEEQLQLLASDGMLVKRPIAVKGDTVCVGFKEKEWESLL